MNPMVDALAVVDDSRTNEGCIAGLAKGKMRARWWSSAGRIWHHVPLIPSKNSTNAATYFDCPQSNEWKYTALNICILIDTNLSCHWVWLLELLRRLPI